MTQPGNYDANVTLSADVTGYQQAMAQAAAATNQTTSTVVKLQNTWKSLQQTFQQKLITHDKEVVASLAVATSTAALFDKQLSTLSATAAVTGQNMKGFRSAIESTFTRLPVARTELVQLATTINQLGVTSSKEIGSMVMTFEKLANTVGGSAGSLASSMLQFTTSMGDASAANVKSMSNTLVSLSKNAGLSAQSILDFAQAIAPIASVAGITEKQTLALSTAFNKAGANGYVAANTFNSMLQDITQLTASGSPQLAKYANILGMTVDQFNRLPNVQKVADIFAAINRQGQAGIGTLNSLGINGVRNITAIQSVISTGGLQQILDQNSQNDPNALNRGAKASFNDLADSLAMTRNIFTQTGTVIGETFVKPMTMAVNSVNSFMHSISMMKTLIATLGSVLGVGLTGVAPLIHFAAPFVAMRFLRRSSVGAGMRAGFGMGQFQNNPEAMAERVTKLVGRGILPASFRNETGGLNEEMLNLERDAEGKIIRDANGMPKVTGFSDQGMKAAGIGWFGRQSMQLGTAMGHGFERTALQEDNARRLRMARNIVLSTPAQLVKFGAQYQTGFYKATLNEPFDEQAEIQRVQTQRLPLMQRLRLSAMTQPYAKELEALPEVKELRGVQKAVARDPGKSIEALEKKSQSLAAAFEKASVAISGYMTRMADEKSAMNVLTKSTGEAALEMGKMTWWMTKASASSLGGAASFAAPYIGRGLAGAGRGLATVGKEFLGSPLGIALTVGTVGEQLYSSQQAKSKAAADVGNEWINPVQKWNEQLGIATTNLAQFSKQLGQATTNMNMPAPTSMAAVASQDYSGVKLNKPVNPVISAWAKGKKDTGSAVALLQTMPITDPATLQAAAQDFAAAGMSTSWIQNTIAEYNSAQMRGGTAGGVGQTIDYKSLAQGVLGTEGKGKGVGKIWAGFQNLVDNNNDLRSSKEGQQLIESGISGIRATQQENNRLYQGPYANTMELKQGSQMFGSLLGQYSQASVTQSNAMGEAIAHGMSKLTGGGYATYDQKLDKLFSSGALKNKTDEQLQQQYIDLLKSTKSGRAYLDKIPGGQNITVQDFDKTLKTAMEQGYQAQAKVFSQYGSLGKFVGTNQQMVEAATTKMGDPIAQFQASAGILAEAMKQNPIPDALRKHGDLISQNSYQLTHTSETLAELIGHIKDNTNVTSQQAQAALGFTDQAQAYQVAGMGRAGRLGAAFQGFQQARTALQNAPSDFTLQYAQGKGENLKSEMQTANGWLIQMEQMIDSANRQRKRSDDDYNLQTIYANQDFQKSMTRSAASFHLSRVRAERDFGIQMKRASEDAAKGWYDPWQRVQATYTNSASSILANLEDQNARIKQQMADLNQASKMGLSGQAIQELDLANPNNAQQLHALIDTSTADPKLIAQINQQVSVRVAGVTQLTQSKYSQTFKRSTEDFARSMGDATKDFKIQTDYAVADHNQALGRMAYAYKIQNQRVDDDLVNSMKEWTGNFTDNVTKLSEMATGAFAKIAPKSSAAILAATTDMKNQFKGSWSDMADFAINEAALLNRAAGVILGGGQTMNYKDQANGAGTMSSMSGYAPAAPAPTKNTQVSGEMVYRQQDGSYRPGNVGTLPNGDRYLQIDAYYWMDMDTGQYWKLNKGVRPPGMAKGGISTSERITRISEGGLNEAVIPLDDRGIGFMAKMYAGIAQEVLRGMKTAGQGIHTVHSGVSYHQTDASTNFTGPITVQAQDPNAMQRKLMEKARLKRLTRPVRQGAPTP